MGERTEDTPHIPLIVIRVQALTPTVDEFVAQYCRYFGVDVVFLPTEGVQPPGRRVRFVFALADGTEVVTGDGVVLRMRRDSNNPQRPPGMELRYQCLDEFGQRVVDRMLLLRTQGLMARPDPPPYVSMWLERDEDTDTTTAVRPQPHAAPPTLPANPFAEVPPQALSYFVDWAIERATDPSRRSSWWWRGRTEFAKVKMRPPRRDRRPARQGLVVAFGGGLATGALVLVLAGGLAGPGGASSAARARRQAAAEVGVDRPYGVGGNAAVSAHATVPGIDRQPGDRGGGDRGAANDRGALKDRAAANERGAGDRSALNDRGGDRGALNDRGGERGDLNDRGAIDRNVELGNRGALNDRSAGDRSAELGNRGAALDRGVAPADRGGSPAVAMVPSTNGAGTASPATATRSITAGHTVASRDGSIAPLHGFARGSGASATALGVSAGDTRELDSGARSAPVVTALPTAPPPPSTMPTPPRDTLDAPEAPPRALPASSRRKVQLLVVSTPPGWVRIDDHNRGRSPLTVAVDSGSHEVVVERPRYLPGHAHVEGPGRVVLELQRPPATLHVTSSPPGAAVRVDNQPAGNTPVNVTIAGYEQHKVEIEQNGRVEKRRIYLRPPLGSVDVDFPGGGSTSSR
jgi:hypothetical protein